ASDLTAHRASAYFLSLLTAPAPTGIYPLSLHDALPISVNRSQPFFWWEPALPACTVRVAFNNSTPCCAQYVRSPCAGRGKPRSRSEEHTSELQSRENLVCRLLLEKKKTDLRIRHNASGG